VQATTSVLGDRYALGPLVGRGGVADVYRAEDLQRGVPVAVKILRNAAAADIRRFAREARTLERLDHPAIVRLRDEGACDGVPYLVLDLVDGEPLSRVIERGPIEEDGVQRMGTALAGALAHAHGLGIVHRDVKPGNVLVDRDGNVRLTDFGIARLLDSAAVAAITETGLVIGTAAYLAPEQVRGETAGPEADVYALGLVLLEALTGERAYAGPPTEAAMARLQRSPEIPVQTPWLASLVAAMTAIDPARRPRAKAVEDAFENRSATSEHTAVMPVPPPASRAPMVLKKRGPLLAALAAVVVALALILVLVGGQTSGGPAPAATSTTTATTVPPTTAAAVTTPPTTIPPATPPQRGDGKGKHGGGGDNKGGNEGG
jgi:serine/threonine protein kinase